MTVPRRLRVCHLIFQPELSGAPRAAMDIGTRLDRRRFEVEVVCGGEGEVVQLARQAELEAHVIPGLEQGRIKPWTDALATVKLIGHFRRAGYDIVHCHSSKAGFMGRLAARLAGRPIAVFTVQGASFHEFSRSATALFYRNLERLVGRWTDGLIFVNHEDPEIYRRLRIARSAVHRRLPNGIDLGAWPPLEPQERRRIRSEWLAEHESGRQLIVFVGRLAPQKAPTVLVDAAARVLDHHPKALFLLVGDGELEDELRQRIRSRGVEQSVRLLGWRQDVADILRAADCFCLPSLWEGLPLSILEAMAARLPVVVSDIRGNRELVRHEETGLLVPTEDGQSLAEALASILRDQALAERLAANAYRTLEESYSIESVTAGTEALYEELVARRPRRPNPRR